MVRMDIPESAMLAVIVLALTSCKATDAGMVREFTLCNAAEAVIVRLPPDRQADVVMSLVCVASRVVLACTVLVCTAVSEASAVMERRLVASRAAPTVMVRVDVASSAVDAVTVLVAIF